MKETLTEYYNRTKDTEGVIARFCDITKDKRAKRGEGIAPELAELMDISIYSFYRKAGRQKIINEVRKEYEQ